MQLIAGMVAAALSFLMSGLLQIYLPESDVPYCHGDINIMWQLPQLLLISFAEVLVSVTGLEFAYSQAPPNFRYTTSHDIKFFCHMTEHVMISPSPRHSHSHTSLTLTVTLSLSLSLSHTHTPSQALVVC